MDTTKKRLGGRPSRGRTAHLHQRCSPEWLAWAKRYAHSRGGSIIDLIVHALEVSARLDGHPLHPPDEEPRP